LNEAITLLVLNASRFSLRLSSAVVSYTVRQRMVKPIQGHNRNDSATVSLKAHWAFYTYK